MSLRTLAARTAASVAAGYLAGTFPSARIVSRLVDAGVDVTRAGTRNPGAANTGALLGRRAGAAVLIMDIAKATIPGLAAARLAGPAGANAATTAAVIGHCHPVWPGSSGGKGVAASGGQMLATFPAYLPIDLAIGAVAGRTHWWRTHTTEATGIICALWVALAMVWYRLKLPNLWGGEPTLAMPLGALTSSLVIMERFVAEDRRSVAEDRRSVAEDRRSTEKKA